MYKLVALDLDGTLLDDDQKIPLKNIEIIKKLNHKGIHIVLVTGRPDIMTIKYVKELGIQSVVLGCNGASIRNVLTKEIFHLETLSEIDLEKSYLYFLQKGLFARFYGMNKVYSFNPNEFADDINPYARFSKRLDEQMGFIVLKDLEELKKHDLNIVKCVYINEDSKKLDEVQNDLRKVLSSEIQKAAPNSIDIVAKGMNKGLTLLKYGKSLGLKAENMIAIGDGENDLSMLEVVGLPIAMENANDIVKSKAKIITSDNNNAGVGEVLEKIFHNIL